MRNFLIACIKLYYKIAFKVKVEGIENFPQDKAAVVIANHMSMHDPILMFGLFNGKINFMAKEELFRNKLFKWVLEKLGAFPVNRQGNDLKAIKHSLKLLKDNKILGIFPQGTRMTSAEAEQAKGGAAFMAIKSKVPIVPVAIKGNFRLGSEITVKVFEEYSTENASMEKEDMERVSTEAFSVIANYLEA